jgi:hypothetical protein
MDRRLVRENGFDENGSANAANERHVAMPSRLLGMMGVVFIEGADVPFGLC